MENQNQECCGQNCCNETKENKWKWGNKCECGCHSNNTCSNIGMSVGVALAVVLSWSANHSILWAIIHGLLNWFYVIYYIFINR